MNARTVNPDYRNPPGVSLSNTLQNFLGGFQLLGGGEYDNMDYDVVGQCKRLGADSEQASVLFELLNNSATVRAEAASNLDPNEVALDAEFKGAVILKACSLICREDATLRVRVPVLAAYEKMLQSKSLVDSAADLISSDLTYIALYNTVPGVRIAAVEILKEAGLLGRTIAVHPDKLESPRQTVADWLEDGLKGNSPVTKKILDSRVRQIIEETLAEMQASSNTRAA